MSKFAANDSEGHENVGGLNETALNTPVTEEGWDRLRGPFFCGAHIVNSRGSRQHEIEPSCRAGISVEGQHAEVGEV
jgi:hypothetical protein